MKKDFERSLRVGENEVESLLVDARTAAKMLGGICERTVRNLSRRGDLPVVKILGRVLYNREDLIEFIRQNTIRERKEG